MSKGLLFVLVALGLSAVMIILGEGDYQAEEQELGKYCQMVADDKWPDYKQIYEEECH